MIPALRCRAALLQFMYRDTMTVARQVPVTDDEGADSYEMQNVYTNVPCHLGQYQKITEEEQNALVNDGVRRKSDNAIVHRPPIVVPLQGRINQLLSQIDNYTAEQITGGFIFEVTSTIPNGPLGLAKFDSAKEDQMTFSTMYAASKSPDFDTTEPYLGHIPMRGYPVIDGEPSDVKQVYYLDAENMQKFNDALALHIGSCKMIGWSLQQQANAATKETIDEIEQNIWQIIGYDPVPQE